jgi:hypothetical protein
MYRREITKQELLTPETKIKYAWKNKARESQRQFAVKWEEAVAEL